MSSFHDDVSSSPLAFVRQPKQQHDHDTIDPYSNDLYNTNSNSIKIRIARSMIDYVQSIRVPVSMVQRTRRIWNYKNSSNSKRNNDTIGSYSNDDDNNSTEQQQKSLLDNDDVEHTENSEQSLLVTVNINDDTNQDNDNNVVYWITGLEYVFLQVPGESCADCVKIVGIKPPRYLWYMISGFLNDILQFIVSIGLYNTRGLDPSACWFLGFTLSIPCRHVLHRYLVFGNYIGGYYHSLGRMYCAYSIIIVLSTIFNKVINTYIQFFQSKEVNFIFIFILTLLWTGIVNYFILKKIWTMKMN